jgi:hypothetical protein
MPKIIYKGQEQPIINERQASMPLGQPHHPSDSLGAAPSDGSLSGILQRGWGNATVQQQPPPTFDLILRLYRQSFYFPGNIVIMDTLQQLCRAMDSALELAKIVKGFSSKTSLHYYLSRQDKNLGFVYFRLSRTFANSSVARIFLQDNFSPREGSPTKGGAKDLGKLKSGCTMWPA